MSPSGLAESLFTPLLTRDPSGRTWLPQVLAALPRGHDQLGEIVDDPGSLTMTQSVRGIDGRLGAFTYPSAAPVALSRWLIEHPERLVWPDGVELTAEARRLLRMLLDDDPPGSRAPTRARALELVDSRSVLSREWWRFEPTTTLGCVFMSSRLVLTVTDATSATLPPSTNWFPARSVLARDLEAARGLADGLRFAGLVLAGSVEVADALTPQRVGPSLDAGLPHLDPLERGELRDAYLGAITVSHATELLAHTGAAPA